MLDANTIEAGAATRIPSTCRVAMPHQDTNAADPISIAALMAASVTYYLIRIYLIAGSVWDSGPKGGTYPVRYVARSMALLNRPSSPPLCH